MSADAAFRPTLVRNVRISGPSARFIPVSGPLDLLLEGDRIADIAPAGALRTTGPIWDAEGRWAIPGLWDHHVHVSPWALFAVRENVHDATSAREVAARMAAVAPDSRGVRVGVGMRDGLWQSPPTLAELDEVTGDIPTYVIGADLHCVLLNSAAARREGITVPVDGMLREAPAFRVHASLDAISDDELDAAVSAAATRAVRQGIVGVVDFDMAWNLGAWQRRGAAGFDTWRVRAGVYPQYLDRAIAEGRVSGDLLHDSGLLEVGSLKVITDGSLGTRTAACSVAYPSGGHGELTVQLEALVELLTRATGAGFSVAVHAIGDVANTRALDAFALSGAHGSLEHAQLVGRTDLPRFARLDVTASVQPQHAVDDRELARHEWAAQHAAAYPLRSLSDAGANLTLGSDAPVAALDPWGTVATAVGRSRAGEPGPQDAEGIDVTTALGASTERGSRAAAELLPGSRSDIAFCDADPFAADVEGLRAMTVGATMLGGRFTHV
ncbi:amidohydrolase [Microbacterium sp. ZW T5_56]|uniref:amidohydrolase n=1 Tax=Microbacterium sp. ZW T5_56 TaxID=3378081 RepID=UPI003851AA03